MKEDDMSARTFGVVIVGAVIASACGNPSIESATSGKGGSGPGAGGNGNGHGGTGGSVSNGAGGFAPMPFGGSGGVAANPGTGGRGPVEGDMTCTSSTAKAMRLPVDIYIL